MRLALYIVCTLFLISAPTASSAETPATPPQWYLDDIAFLTRDGGRWIASNADYKSDNEKIDAFVLEWTQGYAQSMTGRLYGVVDGETTRDFWRFRQYWHPGEGNAVLEQFGAGGAVGVGVIWQEGEMMKSLQTFYAPDGGVREAGHITRNPDTETHVTESFDIIDGDWRPRRSYTWKRDVDNESNHNTE
ncbi:MAG: hypothetical protein ACX939_04985 [Hyphococcus sp.]